MTKILISNKFIKILKFKNIKSYAYIYVLDIGIQFQFFNQRVYVWLIFLVMPDHQNKFENILLLQLYLGTKN